MALNRSATGSDPDHYELVFYARWADWEESGWMIICRLAGEYYVQYGGDCPDGRAYGSQFEPTLISQDDALQLMLAWEEHEDATVTTVAAAWTASEGVEQ